MPCLEAVPCREPASGSSCCSDMITESALVVECFKRLDLFGAGVAVLSRGGWDCSIEVEVLDAWKDEVELWPSEAFFCCGRERERERERDGGA